MIFCYLIPENVAKHKVFGVWLLSARILLDVENLANADVSLRSNKKALHIPCLLLEGANSMVSCKKSCVELHWIACAACALQRPPQPPRVKCLPPEMRASWRVALRTCRFFSQSNWVCHFWPRKEQKKSDSCRHSASDPRPRPSYFGPIWCRPLIVECMPRTRSNKQLSSYLTQRNCKEQTIAVLFLIHAEFVSTHF